MAFVDNGPLAITLPLAMDITEAQLDWLMGGFLLFALLVLYPTFMTVLALIREQRVLGKLYWHWRTLLDARRKR